MNRRWFLQLLTFFPLLRWLLKTPRSPEVVIDTMPDRGPRYRCIVNIVSNEVQVVLPVLYEREPKK